MVRTVLEPALDGVKVLPYLSDTFAPALVIALVVVSGLGAPLLVLRVDQEARACINSLRYLLQINLRFDATRHEIPTVLIGLEVARLIVGPARVVVLGRSREMVFEVVPILLHHDHLVDDLAGFLLVGLVDTSVYQWFLFVLRSVRDGHIVVEHVLQRVLNLRAQRVHALATLNAFGDGVAPLSQPHAVRCTPNRLVLLGLLFLLRHLIFLIVTRLFETHNDEALLPSTAELFDLLLLVALNFGHLCCLGQVVMIASPAS